MNSISLYNKVFELISNARKSLVRNVNYTMVYTYYEIGRMIVEDEQQGTERAEYGKNLLEDLSQKLSKEFGKGFSRTNLVQMRTFYTVYSIHQTLSDEFQNIDNECKAIKTPDNLAIPKFELGWSHYIKLMRISNPDERRFYEIEAINNNWSLRELQRQFYSALYERLALSRDKEGIKQLATQGQLLEKPEDIIKDPYILEFVGLPELSQYSESDLEHEIINKLENRNQILEFRNQKIENMPYKNLEARKQSINNDKIDELKRISSGLINRINHKPKIYFLKSNF